MADDDLSPRAPPSEQFSAPDSDDPKVRDDDHDDDDDDHDDDDHDDHDDDEDHDEDDHDDDDGSRKEARLTRRNSVTLDEKTEAPTAAAAAAPVPPLDGSGGGDVRRPLVGSIRQEHEVNATAPPEGITGFPINRQSFKDRLPVRRPGPISDPELVVSVRPSPSIIARSISRSVSIRNTEATYPESAAATGRAALLSEYSPAHIGSAAEQEDDEHAADNGSSIFGGTDEAPPASEEQPVRVSLMALLGQTDGEWGDGSPSESPAAGADEDDEDDEDAAEENGSGMEYECCVCMVRHKGSAFIPCGHTFCRLCSRELWVSRGNCPLCNGYILEILDIF